MPKHEGRRTTQKNAGEGNKAAARKYNQAQRRFTESGVVEEKAKEAEGALSGPQREALEKAEAIGKRHSAGEDPAVTRKR